MYLYFPQNAGQSPPHFEEENQWNAQDLVPEKNTGKMYVKYNKIKVFLKFLLTQRKKLCIITVASCDALTLSTAALAFVIRRRVSVDRSFYALSAGIFILEV